MRKIVAYLFQWIFKIPFCRNYFFGIHQRVFQPYNLFKNVKVSYHYQGYKLQLHLEDWIQQCLFFTGEYEKAELKVLTHLLKDDSVFIDIGANIGLYSLRATDKIKEKGEVIGFEPFIENFKQLKKHVVSNNLSTIITIENVAIGESEGKLQLYYSDKIQNRGMVSAVYQENAKSYEVEMMRLDDYCAHKNINTINCVKIDVEGYEMNVLKGMTNVLLQFQPILLLEILEENTEQIESFLSNFGYVKYYISDNGFVVKENNNPNRKNYIFSVASLA